MHKELAVDYAIQTVIMKIFYVVLVIGLMSQDTLQWDREEFVNDIRNVIDPHKVSIYQIGTGRTVRQKPEWLATVANEGGCVFRDVKVSCAGFQSVEPIEPLIMSKSGDICTIKNNEIIEPYSNITFLYAWDDVFHFTPYSLNKDCY